MSKVDLKSRSSPKQIRSQRTVEAILTAAAELLEEVGIDRLSTNMVCERAGLAPPSLYRFFPNKYAILRELADRLMRIQNTALSESEIDWEHLEESSWLALNRQFEVTSDFKGGPMIMRSLHAVPVLRQVRLDSHRWAADALFNAYAQSITKVPKSALRRRSRLVIEVGYASLEYAFDSPPKARQRILKDAAHLLAIYHGDLLHSEHRR